MSIKVFNSFFCKRLLVCFLYGLLLLGLAACGGGGGNSVTTDPSTSTESTSTDTAAPSTSTDTAAPSTSTDTAAPSTTASPAGGTFTSPRSVTLTCNDGVGSGCLATFFTMDGSTPTTASTPYAGAIPVGVSKIIRFFSLDNSGNSEKVKTESYVITTSGNPTTLVTFCTISWIGAKETAVSGVGGGYRVYYKATTGVTKSDSFVELPNSETSLTIDEAIETPYTCAYYFAVSAFSADNPAGSALSVEVKAQ